MAIKIFVEGIGRPEICWDYGDETRQACEILEYLDTLETIMLTRQETQQLDKDVTNQL